MSGARFTDAEAARVYILAGHARITLVSSKTGARFTYKIRQPEGAPHFVSVLTGADNEANYTFLGTIFEPQGASGSLVHVYRHGKRSTISEDAPSAKSVRICLAVARERSPAGRRRGLARGRVRPVWPGVDRAGKYRERHRTHVRGRRFLNQPGRGAVKRLARRNRRCYVE